MKTLGVKNICFFFFFFFNLLHLPSLGFILKCYLGEATAASYPARFRASKEDDLLLFPVVSELALIESSAHP